MLTEAHGVIARPLRLPNPWLRRKGAFEHAQGGMELAAAGCGFKAAEDL